MKSHLFIALSIAATGIIILGSCKTKQQPPTLAQEESGLNITKITDETKGVIQDPTTSYFGGMQGKSRGSGMTWGLVKGLDVSPNGEEIAYLARMNNQSNVMVRKSAAGAGGAATQRTFRNVGSSRGAAMENYISLMLPTGSLKSAQSMPRQAHS